ncbi:hypothetical protein BGP34_14910 [Bacillus mycoides]|uniref:matrixin family metalloprotease n=1 Tax=Bacillus mycoides TaxID=1405 RepID=UPI0009940523|nr:matrixin family metalloprotease [Bacillus mycoides]OOR57440.1 hypothetical protein BGP34_14910 [Bacillus mycoides]
MKNEIPQKVGLSINDEGNEVLILKKYLRKYGYLSDEKTESGSARILMHVITDTNQIKPVFDEKTENALMKYQEFYGLKMTKVLDEDTINQMSLPRCGAPDIKRMNAEADRTLIGKWNKENLTYKIENYLDGFEKRNIQEAISSAFSVWSNVIILTFTEVKEETVADIVIKFASGVHGDNRPFDGPGQTVAHTFDPPPINESSIAGDIHFDSEESWTLDVSGSGIDLIAVAIHEIGHSLGLKHSNVKDSIMFPDYTGKRNLHSTDIIEIKKLYH